LPWPDDLNAAQAESVARFEGNGGAVVRLDPSADWDLKSEKPALLKRAKREIRRAGPPPLRIAGPPAMHAVCYRRHDGQGLTISLTNTWGWFRSTRDPNPALNEGTPPPPCGNVTIEIADELGTPKRVFEAVSGRELPIESTPGATRISIPDFQINACLAIDLQGPSQ
jgi:hypothetical protein